MSNIITLARRHYTGTAAEIAGITGSCGDTAYATDTHVYYSWTGASWVVGGEPYFVERLVDKADFDKDDFTCDDNWHNDGLDLSPIVPVGVILVKLGVYVKDDAANKGLSLRRDAVNVENKLNTTCFVANVGVHKVEDISIDADRKLDYSASNVVFTNINLTVLGWWMRRCL